MRSVRFCSSRHRAVLPAEVTSGAGVDRLPTEAWHPTLRESGVIRRRSGRARSPSCVLCWRRCRTCARLRTDQALLVPLVASSRRGYLLALWLPVGFAERAASTLESSDVPAGLLVASNSQGPATRGTRSRGASGHLRVFRPAVGVSRRPALEVIKGRSDTRVRCRSRNGLGTATRHTHALRRRDRPTSNYRAGVTSVRGGRPLPRRQPAPLADAVSRDWHRRLTRRPARSLPCAARVPPRARWLDSKASASSLRRRPHDSQSRRRTRRQLSASVETVQLLGW